MSADSRLTIAAHALAWISLYRRQGHEVAASEQIATSTGIQPAMQGIYEGIEQALRRELARQWIHRWCCAAGGGHRRWAPHC